jgi:hypothetical protein
MTEGLHPDYNNTESKRAKVETSTKLEAGPSPVVLAAVLWHNVSINLGRVTSTYQSSALVSFLSP